MNYLNSTYELKCKVCEGKDVSKLDLFTIKKKLNEVPGWKLQGRRRIYKKFKFANFDQVKAFFDWIYPIIQKQNHHPELTMGYNTVKVSFTTHSVNGLTENDFIMAKLINQLSLKK